MPPVLTLRSSKGAALTHNELDDNFVYLDGKIVDFDSAEISRLIDSGIDQLTILDSAMIQRFTLDSSEVIDLVDSAYVQARQLTFDFLDSSEVINLIDSAYVQARVTLRDSSFVSGIVDSSYVNTILSGGPGNIEILTSSGSVTTTKGGNIMVYIAGGGGGGTSTTYRGGSSSGQVLMTNVAPGATLTATIGVGAAAYNANGGTTTLTDGTSTITMTGGTAADAQAQNAGQRGQCTVSPFPGDALHARSYGTQTSGMGIGRFGLGGHTYIAGGAVTGVQGENFVNTGTDGVVILVGV